MKSHIRLVLVATATMLFCLVSVLELSAGVRAKRKPNFLFILVDDMGWTDAGCLGSKFYETPNIDALAKRGMRFTSGYAACPVCSPTRLSIMTGKYPVRLKATNFFSGRRRGKMLPALFRDHMPLSELTLAEALRAAGYATGFFGKWHLGPTGFDPELQGFDLNVGGWRRGAPRSYFSPYFNPKLKDGPKGEHLPDRLTTDAIDFMKKNKDRPFLLYMSYYSVHTPLQATKKLTAKYRAKAEKLQPKLARFGKETGRKFRQVQDHAVYGGMLEAMDTNIGRIVSALSKYGLLEDTVIIFTSDNGGLATSEGWPTTNLPLRGGKGWLYEGGVRVPFIIVWPDVAEPGSTCDVPVISNDFYPTMLEMAELPFRPQQHLDGVSITPLLRKKGTIPDRPLYWHYPHYSNQGGKPGGSVRVGDHVLIERYEDGRLELFDVKKDLGQKTDLAKKMPQRAAQMQRLLLNWRVSMDANMPRPDPAKKGK